MKILYAKNINGLYHLFYSLFKTDKNLHDKLLLELYENNNLSFLSNNSNMINSPNSILINNNIYYFDSLEHQIRLNNKFHNIIEKYNNNYIDVHYKEIEEKDLDRFIIITFDNDSENVYFKY